MCPKKLDHHSFSITRYGDDDSDTIPRQMLFWYTTIDKEFKYGFSACSHSLSKAEAAEIGRIERKIKVGKMKLLGLEGIDIAEELHMTAAMVSRDLKDVEESEELSERSLNAMLGELDATWDNDEESANET